MTMTITNIFRTPKFNNAMHMPDSEVKEESAAMIREIREFQERFPIPDDAEEYDREKGYNFRDDPYIEVPEGIFNPLTGLMQNSVTRSLIFRRTIREDGNSENAAYIGYRLDSQFGSTPEFYTLQSLKDYCEALRLSEMPRPVMIGSFLGMGATGHSNSTIVTGSVVRGLYAIVSESGFQTGPGTLGYSTHIKHVQPVDSEQDWEMLLELLYECNKGADLPYFVMRVNIEMFSIPEERKEQVGEVQRRILEERAARSKTNAA